MKDDDLTIPKFLRRKKDNSTLEELNAKLKANSSMVSATMVNEPPGYRSLNEKVSLGEDELPKDRTKDEQLIDHFTYIAALQPKEFSAYAAIKKYEVSRAGVKRVLEYFEPLLNDFDCDEDDPVFGKVIRIYGIIVDDCNIFLDNQKKSRRRKSKKPKEAVQAKVAQSLHYMKESTEFKIVSIDPTKIFGSRELWLFNTKYKELHRLVAADEAVGLSMKGTTIQGIDEAKSVRKRLKKPLEFLPKVLDAGRVVIKTLMDDINSRAQPGLPRLTEHVVILKAVK